MEENENTQFLKEIYQTTAMGMEATELILPKVKDESLRGQIERQEENYRSIASKSRSMMVRNGVSDLPEPQLKKAMLWGSIQLNTLANVTPSHIAEIMIDGSTMGIVDMTKKLNHFDEADSGTKELAEEYIANEQKTIEGFKGYLS